jgi:peptide/nickel transport system permease protein
MTTVVLAQPPGPVTGEEIAAFERGTVARLARRTMVQIGVAGLALFIILAIAGQLLTANGIPTGSTAASIFNPPSLRHLLGTDELGRDVLTELAAGALVSLIVGTAATAIAVVVGTLVGLIAGFFRGWLEVVLMRFTDAMLTVPSLPLIIVLAAVVGQGLQQIVLVIGLTSWAGMARLIRSEVLSLRERAFILRARSVGVPPLRIMRVHLLPQILPLVIANTVLISAAAILAEATLSFLGLGDITRPSWGLMLNNAFKSGAAGRGAFWYVLPPGLCIAVLVLSLSFIGHAINEELSPRRLRK